MNNTNKKILVATPTINKTDIQYVNNALKKSEVSGTFGEFIPKFEKEFAQYCECDFGVSTTNGTTAIHLSLAALGIKEGDEVLVSTLTNMAPFFAVLYQGAKPIPVDIEKDTWNINPELIRKKITKKTKAILVVHLFGHPVDMDPILEIAQENDIAIIEDCAEAHGAEYKNKKVGSLGTMGCFSFYANKIITTGEGGMVTTNNEKINSDLKSLKSLSYGDKNKFMHKNVGFNYRMTNIQAALGVSQLSRIEEVIKKKRYIADFYRENLNHIEDIQFPIEKNYARNVYWMFHIVLQNRLSGKREIIMKKLKEKGIETRESFVPFNMQELFIDKGWTSPEECPNANYVAKNGFYLPSGFSLSDDELRYIVHNLNKIIKNL